MGVQWEFVVAQPNGPDAQTKKTVRKAAMRAFRRNQRQERMQQFRKDKAESSPGLDGGLNRKHSRVPKVEQSEGDFGLNSFPLLTPSQRLENEAGLALPHNPVNHLKDRRDEIEVSPRPSLAAPLSNGLDSAGGFSPHASLGSNYYELFRHCT